MQGSRVLFQSGHDAPRFDIGGLSIRATIADSQPASGICDYADHGQHCQIFLAATHDIT
jgi:hypothetical protein